MKLVDHGIQLISRQSTETIRIRTETDLTRFNLVRNGTSFISPGPQQQVSKDFFSHLKSRIEPQENEKASGVEKRTLMRDFKVKIMKMIINAFDLRNAKQREDKMMVEGPCKKTEPSLNSLEGPDIHQGIQSSRLVKTQDVFFEQASVALNTNGWVSLADGRQIAFAAQLEMSHTEYQKMTTLFRIDENVSNPLVIDEKSIFEYKEQVIRTQNGMIMTDPIVVNFDGKGAALTGIKTYFDLNCDGMKEWIPQLAKGSWYLALDRNNNGTIDDGLELFGPETGHGFAELNEFDNDGNGWIDENDPVFSNLRLWRPDEKTGRELLPMDVGAIYLSAVPGTLALRDSDDFVQGQMREHSVWLHESSGAPGFVHEMDLSI